jgi:hypothetical protein
MENSLAGLLVAMEKSGRVMRRKQIVQSLPPPRRLGISGIKIGSIRAPKLWTTKHKNTQNISSRETFPWEVVGSAIKKNATNTYKKSQY